MTQSMGIKRVSIGDGNDGYTDFKLDRSEMDKIYGKIESRLRYSIAVRAGREAQERWMPSIGAYGCEHDEAQFHSLDLKALCQENPDRLYWKDYIEAECKKLIDERWVAIDALANELLRHTTLEGDKAIRIIDAALDK